MVVRSSVLLAQRAGNAQIRMELEMLNVYRYVRLFGALCDRVEAIFVKLFAFNFCGLNYDKSGDYQNGYDNVEVDDDDDIDGGWYDNSIVG